MKKLKVFIFAILLSFVTLLSACNLYDSFLMIPDQDPDQNPANNPVVISQTEDDITISNIAPDIDVEVNLDNLTDNDNQTNSEDIQSPDDANKSDDETDKNQNADDIQNNDDNQNTDDVQNNDDNQNDKDSQNADNNQSIEDNQNNDESLSSGTDNVSISEDGTYTSKEDVALYIHTYKHLPSNFITKNEAKELGWDSSKGNLGKVAPGKSIGGDKFGNREGLLPKKSGRQYYECDIDSNGSYRNSKRIIFSNDGLIYYTEDHYESFVLLYE